MATISFYLDTRATGRDKPAPLKIAIRHRNKATYIPTDIYLLPEQWDAEKQKIVDHPRAVMYNNKLAHRKLDVEGELLSLAEMMLRKDAHLSDMLANNNKLIDELCKQNERTGRMIDKLIEK